MRFVAHEIYKLKNERFVINKFMRDTNLVGTITTDCIAALYT